MTQTMRKLSGQTLTLGSHIFPMRRKAEKRKSRAGAEAWNLRWEPGGGGGGCRCHGNRELKQTGRPGQCAGSGGGLARVRFSSLAACAQGDRLILLQIPARQERGDSGVQGLGNKKASTSRLLCFSLPFSAPPSADLPALCCDPASTFYKGWCRVAPFTPESRGP